jgi:hypothetical protein
MYGMPTPPPKVIRVPVKYRYDAIHPEFLKMLAEIAAYADEKYGSWTRYMEERMSGDADPINHIYEHAREFRMRVPYDHFEGDVRRHLAAIAYNAMMKFVEETKWGPRPEPHTAINTPLRGPAPANDRDRRKKK